MKTRQQAIADQKNPVIRATLERMTDEQYAEHRAKMERSIQSGAMAKTVKRMARQARFLPNPF